MTRDVRQERLLLLLLLVLTAVTGIVDAASYLALGGVFSGNMTGNVVILGLAATGAGGLPVSGPALALACFATGAAAGGRFLRRTGAAWEKRYTVLLTGVALIMAVCGLTLFAAGSPPSPAVEPAVTSVLALAMGTQAALARKLAVRDVTTVVVTSALTGLAADSPLGAARPQPWARRVAVLVLLAAGAAAGALLIRFHTGLALSTAAVLACATAVTGRAAARGHRTGGLA